MNYPRYPEYKPSGVEWLGEVPAHWGLKRLKFATACINDKQDVLPEGLEYVAMEHIESWTGKRLEVENGLMPESQTNRFQRGDVLFGKLRPYLAKAWLADRDGVCSTELLVLRERNLEPAYLRYWTLMRSFVEVVDGSTYGSKMPRASWDFIGNVPALIPERDEQHAIAAFLDRETARIDALIAKKQRLIELLAEKRTALISQAVTKGLNSGAPMKDSGVEWLGEIPAHWQKHKFHYLFAMMGGITPDKGKSEYWEGDVPWITPKDMKVDEIGDSEDKLTQLALRETNIRLIDPGVVLVVVRGMILVHTFPVAVTTCRATINQDMKALIPVASLSPEYLAWLLRGISLYVLGLVEESAHGTKALRTDQFQSIEIYLPSLDEQKAIVDHISVGTARLDELRTKVESAIEKLKEYRAALIADAITGKIDVRQATKPVADISRLDSRLRGNDGSGDGDFCPGRHSRESGNPVT